MCIYAYTYYVVVCLCIYIHGHIHIYAHESLWCMYIYIIIYTYHISYDTIMYNTKSSRAFPVMFRESVVPWRRKIKALFELIDADGSGQISSEALQWPCFAPQGPVVKGVH